MLGSAFKNLCYCQSPQGRNLGVSCVPRWIPTLDRAALMHTQVIVRSTTWKH